MFQSKRNFNLLLRFSNWYEHVIYLSVKVGYFKHLSIYIYINAGGSLNTKRSGGSLNTKRSGVV